MPRISTLSLDYTALSAWRTCPRKFSYSMLYGYRTEESSALAFGRAMHAGLASWHTAAHDLGMQEICEHNRAQLKESGDLPYDVPHDCSRCSALYAFSREARQNNTLPALAATDARSIPNGLDILWRYIDHYDRTPRAHLRPERVPGTGLPYCEQHLTMSLGDIPHPSGTGEVSLTYTGTIDLFGSDPASGELMVMEHKTTARLGETFFHRIKPNDQVTGYIALLQHQGYNVQTCLWNAIQTVRNKYESTPSECFARVKTYRTPTDIADWRHRVRYDAARIVTDIESGIFSANMPDACTQYNTLCPYADCCNAAADDRHRILQASFTHNPWPNFSVEVNS